MVSHVVNTEPIPCPDGSEIVCGKCCSLCLHEEICFRVIFVFCVCVPVCCCFLSSGGSTVGALGWTSTNDFLICTLLNYWPGAKSQSVRIGNVDVILDPPLFPVVDPLHALTILFAVCRSLYSVYLNTGAVPDVWLEFIFSQIMHLFKCSYSNTNSSNSDLNSVKLHWWLTVMECSTAVYSSVLLARVRITEQSLVLCHCWQWSWC